MSVKYYIDGEELTPKQIAGKSGDLEIKINYTNNERVGDVRVPFLVVSTMMLKDDNFSNVTIDNGKVIDDGDKQIVVGMFDRLEKTDDVYITARIDGIRAHETVFINEFRVVKNRTHYNKLDWMWGNKMFRVKTLRTKKVLFSDDPVRDMDRLYNNSKYQKSTHCGFVSTLTQSDVLANVKSITVKAGYPCKLWSEARRLALIEKWNTPVITAGQKIKRKRLKYMGAEIPKQYLKVGGKAIISYTVEQFARNTQLEKVIVLVPEDWIDYTVDLLKEDLGGYMDRIDVTEGGEMRNDTIMIRMGVDSITLNNTLW